MAEIELNADIKGREKLEEVLTKISALAKEADALVEELRSIDFTIEIRSSDSH